MNCRSNFHGDWCGFFFLKETGFWLCARYRKRKKAVVTITLYSDLSCVSWLNFKSVSLYLGQPISPPPRSALVCLSDSHSTIQTGITCGKLRQDGRGLKSTFSWWGQNSLKNLFSADNLSVYCSAVLCFQFVLCMFEGM